VVLVTGATGYLASCLVKQMADAGGYRIRCTVRSLENNKKLNALKDALRDSKTQPEFVKADLLQSADQWME
jgi:nucleoside-diphosphate-sugar epimerase